MTIFKFRRGLAAVLALRNPILREGEPVFEADTGKLKIGDGISNWLSLGYLSGEGAPGPQGEPGTNGVDGVNGQSAYQVAVASGFVGTVSQWLASLKGDTGAQGPQGIQGVQGNVGAGGAAGPKGDTGDTGPAGADGVSYTGPKITTASVAPSSPTAGDVWIDTSS